MMRKTTISSRFLFGTTLLTILLWSCGNRSNHQDNNENALTVTINDYEDHIIRHADFAANVDSIALRTGQFFMGTVADMCLHDSVAYVIDRPGSAWAFNLPCGKLMKRIQRIGHGNGEYISLHAIDVKDSTVYLLDSEAGMVLAHDLMFNFKKSFRLNFPALDFIKIDDGFLFCNLNTTPELHRFVHTDNDGNIVGSYLPSEMEMDMISDSHVFTQDEKGNVFMYEPYSDDIYQWTTQGPQLAFRTDYGKDAHKKDAKESREISNSTKIFNASFFVTQDYFINSFIQDHTRYYSFKPLDKASHLQGFVDTAACIPFYPIAQYKDGLTGICHTSDLDKWKPKKDSCDAVLFIFHLK